MGSEGGQGERGVLFLKRSTLCTLEVVKDSHPSGSIPELNFFQKRNVGFQGI